MTKQALVVGNGKSREGVDFSRISSLGDTFGCNALYRDFAPSYTHPNYLCVVDYAMKHEIFASGYPRYRVISAIGEEELEPFAMHGVKNRPRNNAGLFAIMKAIEKGYKRLFLLGFDFLAIEKEDAISNMYDGTDCYGPDTRASLEDTRNRMHYFAWILESNPKIRFDLVFPKNVIVYAPMVDNVKLMNYDRLYNEAEHT